MCRLTSVQEKEANKRMKHQQAIYPGSFDPITNGHLDILDRSLKLFSHVTLVVAGSRQKKPLLSLAERLALIQEVTADRAGVSVESCSGLLMDYAKKKGVVAVIRGLRAASDFEFEFMMASMNKKLNPEAETVFLMTAPHLYFVSSTMMKEIFYHGGDISAYVPKAVALQLQEKFKGVAPS